MGGRTEHLPQDFADLLAEADLPTLQAVFDDCVPDARGGYAEQTALAFDACPDDLARWLVAQGADVDAPDRWGNTPLHTRARSGRSTIDVLLELGADVHADGATVGTPLHAAAASLHAENAALLLAHGADVDARNRDGLTPLELALRSCSNIDLERAAPFARLLLDAGATRTPAMSTFVEEIGQRFEEHREKIPADLAGPASAGLDALYRLFGVVPAARRARHDGVAPIVVTSTRWQDQHAELWDSLVPGSGAAATVQGEVVRISGRLAHELEGNGGANWDDDFRAMARAFADHVATGTPLPDADLAEVRTAVDDLVRTGSGATARLAELAVAWVLRNPDPRPLDAPGYRR
ncbi:ankyrin repeat domain-containing protein [Cellulomonas wangsupingiae]|uniref:Ankyrin repeat domain-containing protein n=1 Tax=Cellulomonas wangsupingiae TaxID=2968085 RepID=A0ABY5K3K5_9CELL|nr:ankyrin repeat domain-containing protein [Cellulomonas wangsupingiae]MCC2333779.1 ankyrin repeat domain-containing protein [Cellulomonas wangsupingiae]UUI65042.1 ankyrin repeat domain-containing protein [Cellulomonas wangsupingiae]